jgi:hypothetical protein
LIDAADELVASAEAADSLGAVVGRLAACAEEQSVDFTLRDQVMASGCLHAAQLFLVDPLLDGGKADAQLQ